MYRMGDLAVGGYMAVAVVVIDRSQYYSRSRQCGRPVGIRPELVRNPIINVLIQHTFKLNFLFVEKYTEIPFDYMKLFPVDHKSP